MTTTTRPHLLPIQFLATAAIALRIEPGQIRRHGLTPLLLKSVPAHLAAARAARTGTAA